MSWQDILKTENMRERMSMEEAEEKTEPILGALMEGIDVFEEQHFTPSNISSGEEQKELEEEFFFSAVYDTPFGRVSFTVTVDGKVLHGYFEEGREITMADARKENEKMSKEQDKEYAGETQRSQIGYAETPDEYYYN